MGNKAEKTLIAIVAIMLAIKLLDIFFFADQVSAGRSAEFPVILIGATAIAGYIGMKLAPMTGFPEMWDKSINITHRVTFPILIAFPFSLVFMAFDYFVVMGDMNVGFPVSIPFYIFGGTFL